MRTVPDRATCYLRQWRIENDATLADVGDLSGLSVPELSRIERGQRNPPATTKLRIARALGVPIRELFAPLSDLSSLGPDEDLGEQTGSAS